MRLQGGALRLSLIGLLAGLALLQGGCRRGAPARNEDPNEDPSGWRRVAVDGIYSLAVPPDTSNETYPAVESNIGFFKSPSFEMHIAFAGDSGSSPPETSRVKARIDGHDAEIVRAKGIRPPWTRPLWLIVHIPNVVESESDSNHLSVLANCADEKAQDTAERMVRSIRFLPPAPPKPKPGALPPLPPPPPPPPPS